MADNVETPEQELARLKQELEEANGIIAEQTEKLAESELRTAGTLPVVTYDKEQYQVTAAKFNFKGTDYAAEALSSSPDLVKELITSGSGLLVKIEKEKK